MFSSSANDDSESLSRCRSASPPGEALAYYPQSQPADALSSTSPVSSTENTQMDVSDGSFAPTVTTISSTPDLQWMVQPTIITSVSPSPGREQSNEAQNSVAATPKVGGKKSTRKGKNERLSPEEEEKMRIRRERNKMAAAKCRNRRRELTDTLQAETDKLEEDKATLQAEISSLLKEKKRLEYVLASHRPTCQMLPDLEHMFPPESTASTQQTPASPSSSLGQLLSPEEEDTTPQEEDTSTLQEDLEDPSMPSSSSSSSSSSGLPYSAISGNSNILLCAMAKEDEEEEEASDLCDLEPSLDVREEEELLDSLLLETVSCATAASAAGEDGGDIDDDHMCSMETARSVPDIDLSGTLGLADWETLYRSVAGDLEPLSTPVLNVSTPTCGGGGFTSVFTFASCPPEHEMDAVPDGAEFLKVAAGKSTGVGGGGGDSRVDILNSPTLLAL